MKATPWITYRTRFLVKARQLTANLSFTDELGREHSGRKGDYLVESSDGVLRIAPRQIFEDIYVQLLEEQLQTSAPIPLPAKTRRGTNYVPVKKEIQKSEVPSLAPFLVRKSPQPDHSRGSQISHSL